MSSRAAIVIPQELSSLTVIVIPHSNCHPSGLVIPHNTCHPERSEGSAVIVIPRKNSAPLRFGEGHDRGPRQARFWLAGVDEFHSCRNTRAIKAPSTGCGKTLLRSGLGKGTSSTRAVRTAPQRRLPAAEGMPPCKTNFSASCWFPVPQIYQICLSSRAQRGICSNCHPAEKLRSTLVWGRARVPLVP